MNRRTWLGRVCAAVAAVFVPAVASSAAEPRWIDASGSGDVIDVPETLWDGLVYSVEHRSDGVTVVRNYSNGRCVSETVCASRGPWCDLSGNGNHGMRNGY